MTIKATVHDFEPSAFRNRLRGANSPAEGRGVFADMVDGATVMQLFFNYAGFEWKETKIFLPVAELCGESGRPVCLYDDELAEHARCTDRTVRNWRRDYLLRAETVSFHPLEVAEGEYDHIKQRYERTAYTVAPAVAEAVERAVAAARLMPEYQSDRMGCLERAARPAYADIPDAPAKKDRKRKPGKSKLPAVVQSVKLARKSLGKGQVALREMPSRTRAAFIEEQGAEMREELLALQKQIGELLSAISQDAESVELDDKPEKLSGIPPERGDAFRVEDKGSTRKADEAPDPEAVAAFESITQRLTAPRVQTVAVELRVVPDAIPDEKAIHARVAELIGAKQITTAEGWDFKSKAHDASFRQQFAARYMAGGGAT